jgi:hypothetical protein
MIALMMEASRTSETSVGNYFTRQYIPEDKSELERSDSRDSVLISFMRRCAVHSLAFKYAMT